MNCKSSVNVHWNWKKESKSAIRQKTTVDTAARDEQIKRINDLQDYLSQQTALLTEFDEELVHELIKRIYVGMDNSVEVEFKCSDPYQEVLAIMSEVQNE